MVVRDDARFDEVRRQILQRLLASLRRSRNLLRAALAVDHHSHLGCYSDDEIPSLVGERRRWWLAVPVELPDTQQSDRLLPDGQRHAEHHADAQTRSVLFDAEQIRRWLQNMPLLRLARS